jgi:hypothetical protein
MSAVSITTRTREHEGGQHVDVSVFVGPAGRTRALCGVLTMTPAEAHELVERLARGEVTP